MQDLRRDLNTLVFVGFGVALATIVSCFLFDYDLMPSSAEDVAQGVQPPVVILVVPLADECPQLEGESPSDFTGHDLVDKLGGWDVISERKKSLSQDEYEDWIEEHSRSQDGPFIGNGG